MIKKIIMILVLSVFALSSFSETAEHHGVKDGDVCKKGPKVIEIQIACRLDKLSEYLKEDKGEKGKPVRVNEQFYFFHTKGTDKKLKEVKSIEESFEKLTKHLSKEEVKSITKSIAKLKKHLSKEKVKSITKSIVKFNAKSAERYKSISNYVSIEMIRGQKINWTCRFPFTIYYGGRSILTTDEFGWAQPGKIISYLQGKKVEGEIWYQTPDAWIINNALNGTYKYFVSVYVPESDTVYIDDPETIVRPPE